MKALCQFIMIWIGIVNIRKKEAYVSFMGQVDRAIFRLYFINVEIVKEKYKPNHSKV